METISQEKKEADETALHHAKKALEQLCKGITCLPAFRGSLAYCVKNKLIFEEEIANAKTEGKKYKSIKALNCIKLIGIEGAQILVRKDLEYGLKNNLFTQADIDKKQAGYKERMDFLQQIYEPKAP